MITKYYFNGNYLIKGIKFFNKIIGVVIASNNTTFYTVGKKVTVNSETFTQVNKDKIKHLKDWGYLSSF